MNNQNPRLPQSSHESPPWGMMTKAIVASTFLILTALIIWRFKFLLTPLTLAGILAYLLHPLIRFLNHRSKIRRTFIVIGIYAILLLILLGGTVALGLVAADQISRLAVTLPDLVPRLITQAQTITDRWAGVELSFGPYQISFQALSDLINWNAIADEARGVLQQLLGQSTVAIAGAAQATLSTLGTALTVFFISIYISIEGPRIGETISDLAQQPGYRKDADRLIVDTLRIWNSYLRGQVILALMIFVVVSLALGVLRVNNALALGIISGLLEFLPVIGAIIGAGVAVLVAFFQTPPWGLSPVTYSLIVLGVMIVIQQVQGNIMVPRMVGDSVNVHPLLVLIAVLMGASLAGLLGAVLAAPVVGTLKLLAVYIWRKMLDLHPFPDDLPDTPSDHPAATVSETKSTERFATGRNGDTSTPEHPELAGRPLTFAPLFKDYIWGGRNLERVLGRELPPGIVAESWEIAAHPNGTNIITDGPLAGMSLAEATAQYGVELLGTRNRVAAQVNRFALLIKLLDAQRWLSVQVHPDDAYAQTHAADLGKTEMWIVLHAEPNAEIVYGFSRPVSRAELGNALTSGDPAQIEPLLHKVTVQTGDVVYVPAGAVHALGPGIIVAEIQQNSDTTYRLYDWGRDREIHVEQALDVLDFNLIQPVLEPPRPVISTDLELDSGVKIDCIGHSPYFSVERLVLPPGSSVRGTTTRDTFEIFGVLHGAVQLRTGHHNVAETVEHAHTMQGVAWSLLPAVPGEYALIAPGHAQGNPEGVNARDAVLDAVVVRIYTPRPATVSDPQTAAHIGSRINPPAEPISTGTTPAVMTDRQSAAGSGTNDAAARG